MQIFGYIFSPVMFAVGVPWAEALDAGSFLGQAPWPTCSEVSAASPRSAVRTSARLGLRAVLRGTLANLMNAAVAGALIV